MPGVSVAHEPGASGHSGLHAPRTVTTPSGQAPGVCENCTAGARRVSSP